MTLLHFQTKKLTANDQTLQITRNPIGMTDLDFGFDFDHTLKVKLTSPSPTIEIPTFKTNMKNMQYMKNDKS